MFANQRGLPDAEKSITDVSRRGAGAALISFTEACSIVEAQANAILAARVSEAANCDLIDALGRRLAVALIADRDQPPFPARHARWVRGSAEGPASRYAVAGGWPDSRRRGVAAGNPPVAAGEAVEIMTGAPLPPGADAVLMVEHVQESQSEPGVDAKERSGRNDRCVRSLGELSRREKMSFQQAVRRGAAIFCWSRGLDLGRNKLRWRLPAVFFPFRFFLSRMSQFSRPVTNWSMHRHRREQWQSVSGEFTGRDSTAPDLRFEQPRTGRSGAAGRGKPRCASVPHGMSGTSSPQVSRRVWTQRLCCC